MIVDHVDDCVTLQGFSLNEPRGVYFFKKFIYTLNYNIIK